MVSNFYSIPLPALSQLPQRTFLELRQAIEIIESRRTLIQMNVQDYPRMDKKKRKEFYDIIYKKAYPNRKKETVTGKEMMRKLKNGK